MTKGQKFIIVDDYTHNLLQQIVDQKKAGSLADAIKKAASSYLGIRYKSKEELKLEQDLANVTELGKKVTKEE